MLGLPTVTSFKMASYVELSQQEYLSSELRTPAARAEKSLLASSEKLELLSS